MDINDELFWSGNIPKAEHMNALYALIGTVDCAESGDSIVPHLHRLYDLLKEHYARPI